jgi:hypothetical protein
LSAEPDFRCRRFAVGLKTELCQPSNPAAREPLG